MGVEYWGTSKEVMARLRRLEKQRWERWVERRARYLCKADGGKPEDYLNYWAIAAVLVEREPAISKVPKRVFYFMEQRLEGVYAWLESLAVIDILNILGSLGIVIAVGSFVAGQDKRHEQDVFAAWQTITGAAGQSGSGGRIEALEFLNSRPWRFPWPCAAGEEYPDCLWRQSPQSLAGVDLGIEEGGDRTQRGAGAFLWDLQVPNSSLAGANFQDANLFRANLENAFLVDANLQNTNLVAANLRGAAIWRANLQDASLGVAILVRATLWDANLQDADLGGSNLQNASLSRANLQGVNLDSASYTTEATTEEVCVDIYRESNSGISDAELALAKEGGWVYPCPTVWRGAVYDNRTFPPDDSFDFEAVGMIHIDTLKAELTEEEIRGRYGWYQLEDSNDSQP